MRKGIGSSRMRRDLDEMRESARRLQPPIQKKVASGGGCDDIEATEWLLACRPESRVVLVTVHDDPALTARGYEAGALANVLKTAAAHDLVSAVRSPLRGERFLSAHARRDGPTNADTPRSSDQSGKSS